ncbi:MAG: hypothetical protein COZ27_04110 [Candidatus Moranbacteria bacterium CG_4_10_14_3_um_filter_41_65]|nr:MAG: hypothetical protein COX32_03795 [Candidatus Moranbacteria bacterium CG23_combo_of_CG06-09_8_20_14_all_41_28]PIV85975.1 MAG: hypothetical protein COW50_04005 [Candidatus Moranbacteria bacterium CG17_big_fil_post_rev_8_21_14_2_50_41_107]PIW94404.1 MAG: hypothetical protein COZ86_01285 [Candidatus Moranbacteria bacterium CG_4_8_14_3_um_filter_41_13]PIX91058.1 MAG: hypothetical protein COZ27_04110 [Candidatus Moranbacteria bacterium CG_4_10_14_3_um_filter_41_65]PJC00149.1 MAG: hypothetical
MLFSFLKQFLCQTVLKKYLFLFYLSFIQREDIKSDTYFRRSALTIYVFFKRVNDYLAAESNQIFLR